MTAFFNESYRRTPPWDIGRPQGEFAKLAKEGKIRGRVLDVGCGTGENALLFAGLGLEVWGADAAPLAIDKARTKASERRARVMFEVADALELGELGQEVRHDHRLGALPRLLRRREGPLREEH